MIVVEVLFDRSVRFRWRRTRRTHGDGRRQEKD
jgi:hypothetical protein